MCWTDGLTFDLITGFSMEEYFNKENLEKGDGYIWQLSQLSHLSLMPGSASNAVWVLALLCKQAHQEDANK